MRPDAARWFMPGVDLRAVHPALALKYAPDQPRVLAGNGRESGRWTDSGGGAQTPTGDIVVGGEAPGEESEGLSAVAEPTRDPGGVQLAGEIPTNDPPPEVPDDRPAMRSGRMSVVRAIAGWVGRIGTPFTALEGVLNMESWLHDYRAVLNTYNDPPRTLEELQAGVGQGRPGYDDHHIVEQTWAERFGFTRSEIDDPSNLVSIPRMRHWDITGWYARQNPDFGNLSPREYLADKPWEERRAIGLRALREAGVLK